jgi:hypothetical protein
MSRALKIGRRSTDGQDKSVMVDSTEAARPEDGASVRLRLSWAAFTQLRRLATTGQMCDARTRDQLMPASGIKSARRHIVLVLRSSDHRQLTQLASGARMSKSVRLKTRQRLGRLLDSAVTGAEPASGAIVRSDPHRTAGPPPRRRLASPIPRSEVVKGIRLTTPLPVEGISRVVRGGGFETSRRKH